MFPTQREPLVGRNDAEGPTYSFKCHRQTLKSSLYNPDGVTRQELAKPLPVKDGKSKEAKQKERQDQHVYAVNAIEFDPASEGTFISGGSDGHMTYWEAIQRNRLKTYSPLETDVVQPPTSIASVIEHTYDAKAYLRIEPVKYDKNKPQEKPAADAIEALHENTKRITEAQGGLTVGLPITALAYSSDQTYLVYARGYDWSKGHAHAPAVDQQGNLADPSLAPKMYIHCVTRQDAMKLHLEDI